MFRELEDRLTDEGLRSAFYILRKIQESVSGLAFVSFSTALNACALRVCVTWDSGDTFEFLLSDIELESINNESYFIELLIKNLRSYKK